MEETQIKSIKEKNKNRTENDGNRDYRDSDNANIKCISETI
jgi:hypothetical protein